MNDEQRPPRRPGKYTTNRAVTVTAETPEGVIDGSEWGDGEPRYGLTQAWVTRQQIADLVEGRVLAIDFGQEYVVTICLLPE
ncbi:hypothetical protein [Cryobacterium sp. CG_9.6]|uniref:hypothetical protein n=1 Tax=Cryobacterium sp. CG_9.6 TaxID=2760710 RepID=UPI0024737778|nr:hypothetical protein [Cryobacterium sp. CG_9.6]MDH6236265.1 hypothetical protein [Cryobacterium sp. CG_9.6]